MRILVAEAYHQVRWALRTIIKQDPRSTWVGEVRQGNTLLEEVERTHPDLVLLSWDLPGRPGIEHLAALLALDSRPKVIVLSNELEVKEIALAAGAEAFVNTAGPPQQLLNALHDLQLAFASVESERAIELDEA